MIWNGTDPLQPDHDLIPLQKETRHDRRNHPRRNPSHHT